jgi:hypothetical protein
MVDDINDFLKMKYQEFAAEVGLETWDIEENMDQVEDGLSNINNEPSIDPEENYISFRTVLRELEERANIHEEYDSYNQSLNGLLLYGLKFLIIESNLTEDVAREEFSRQMILCQMELEDESQYEYFYNNLLDEESGWSFAAKTNAEEAGDLGIGMIWAQIILAANKIEDSEILNRIVIAYGKYITALAGYLTFRYDNRMFADKASLYIDNLIMKIKYFTNMNRG